MQLPALLWVLQLALLAGPTQGAAADWKTLLEEVRTEQAAFWNEAENWVASAQGFNAQWSSEIGALEKQAQEAKLKAEGEMKATKEKMAEHCPVSCKMDPIQTMEWQQSAEHAHLFAAQTDAKREIADFSAELDEAKTLAERFDDFSKKTNVLHFKAKEEFDQFEAFLNERVLPKTQEAAASLIRLQSSRDLHTSLRKALVNDHDLSSKSAKPSKATLVKPFEIKLRTLKMTKAACTAMKTTYDSLKEIRKKIDSSKTASISRQQGAIAKYQAKAKKATEDAQKFKDVYGGFEAICKKELATYTTRTEQVGDLSPKEVADEYGGELDRHHEWWRMYCGNMKSSAGMVNAWLELCQKAWQSGVLGAEERILDVEGSQRKVDAEDFGKATEGMCKDDSEFDEEITEMEGQVQGIGEFCGTDNCTD